MNPINHNSWTINTLWEGAILASIAHAIMVSTYPDIANEHSWDGMNYSIQNSQGMRGTITFQQDSVFGAIRDDKQEPIENIEDYLKELPPDLMGLAKKEALLYLLLNVEGQPYPVITTAFWGIKDKLYINESFESFLERGGCLLETLIKDKEEAIRVWEEYYEMSKSQIELLKMLFKKKISAPDEKIFLNKTEVGLIGDAKELDLEESKISFAEMDIFFGSAL